MKYEKIFGKVSGGDAISLSRYSVEAILKKDPDYVSFCYEKTKLRKEFEREYGPLFKGPLSFRVYLESLVSAILHNKEIYAGYDKLFGEKSERVKGELSAKTKEFYSLYPSIEQDLLSFIWNDENYISDCFEHIGLKPFCFKGLLKDLFQLKNGQVGLTLFFRLNEESKKIFIERVVDDCGDKIGHFQNVEIFSEGKILLSSITHEDFYSFER